MTAKTEPTRRAYALIVGATIEYLRRRASLTQSELAAAARLSQPKVSRIETGNGRLTVWELRGLAQALGLRTGSGSRRRR